MKILTTFFFVLSLMASAMAAPGAHGPNGEHLDGPVASAADVNVPHIETFTEAFELVGQLAGGELSVMIDRYETNEPVLNGRLELEYKGMKALAKFHPDLGDYSFDDPALLKALSAPGKHALLFTLVAGDESDLLEGTLEVAAEADHHDHDHDHDHGPAWPLYLAIAVALALAFAVLIVRRRRRPLGK